MWLAVGDVRGIAKAEKEEKPWRMRLLMDLRDESMTVLNQNLSG